MTLSPDPTSPSLSSTDPERGGSMASVSEVPDSTTEAGLRTGGLAGISLLALSFAAFASAGCNSFDPAPRPGAGIVRIAPTDDREAVVSQSPAAPIMGSNLLSLTATNGVAQLMASDPSRDRVSFIGSNIVEVATGPGSRPNRAAQDASGFVHVALRGTGELAMIHPSGEVVARDKICSDPRGVAVDAANNEVLVACAEGALVRHSTDPLNYTTIRTLPTDADVRDVVVQGETLYVSRLRSAEVLEFSGDELIKRHTLPDVTLTSDFVRTTREGKRFKPSVAWKMVAAQDGDGVFVLHQLSMVDAVGQVEDTEGDTGGTGGGSSYGGGSELGTACDSIVQPAISRVRTDGSMATSDSISGAVLAVDMVVRNDRGTQLEVVLASAGNADSQTPKATTVRLAQSDNGEPSLSSFESFDTSGSVFSGLLQMHPASADGQVLVGCAPTDAIDLGNNSPATSVIETPTGELAVLQREPAALSTGSNEFQLVSRLDLGGESVLDTGHEIFHRDSGGGIACASCHPEAEDDGHVWNFADVGERKTQFLGIPLSETAPFHWDGSLPNLGSLMDEVFVVRMGGVFQSQQRLDVLGDWMSTLERHGAPAGSNDGAVSRGKALFEASDVGCADCHSGDAFTNNLSYAVGSSGNERLQVPSLTGLVLHPPYMHNGCAKTLRERFEPECGGGDAHGKTSQLDEAQLDDLVAYMSSL